MDDINTELKVHALLEPEEILEVEDMITCKLAEAWNLFLMLPPTSDKHRHQFSERIDTCHAVIMHRKLQRYEPGNYPINQT